MHDLVLLARLHALDRLALVGRSPVSIHVRVSALSALLALVFFPVMCGKGEGAYTRVSGAEWDGYAERWLLVSAAAVRRLGRALPAPCGSRT